MVATVDASGQLSLRRSPIGWLRIRGRLSGALVASSKSDVARMSVALKRRPLQDCQDLLEAWPRANFLSLLT